MYGSEGEVRSDNHDILRYQIPTTAGQSGSPIFFQKENEYFVIGVHTTGVTANNSYNLGVNIDDKRIKFWIQSIIGKIERKLDLCNINIIQGHLILHLKIGSIWQRLILRNCKY